MKTLAITTTLAVVTTATFGAASLRAPQLGGGATTTPAATTTTARAGTLRAQTTKTSMSTSNAAPTVTASISEPAASETTDARLSFLKGIKNLNSGKTNSGKTNSGKTQDTTAANNDLNSLNNRIEELQSKLDAAELAQSTVLTESTIDAKINEKLAQLSIAPADTYSKAEINKLLPTFDERSNGIKWTDVNGVSSTISPYSLVYTHDDTFAAYVINIDPISSTSIDNWVRQICDSTVVITPQGASYIDFTGHLACCRTPAYEWGDFAVGRVPSGYRVTGSGTPIVHGKRFRELEISTYMDDAKHYIEQKICGDLPETECWVVVDDINEAYCGVPHTSLTAYILVDQPIVPTLDDRGNITWTDPNGHLISIEYLPYYLEESFWQYGNLTYSRYYKLREPGSLTEIPNEWITEICSNSSLGIGEGNLITCGLDSTVSENLSNNIVGFIVTKAYTGFYQYLVKPTPQGMKYFYVTFQDLTKDQLRSEFCDEMPESACWVSDYLKHISNAITWRSFAVNMSYSASTNSSSD